MESITTNIILSNLFATAAQSFLVVFFFHLILVLVSAATQAFVHKTYNFSQNIVIRNISISFLFFTGVIFLVILTGMSIAYLGILNSLATFFTIGVSFRIYKATSVNDPTKPDPDSDSAKETTMIGYKALRNNKDIDDFKYKIGQKYQIDYTITLHERGFHFYQKLIDLHNNAYFSSTPAYKFYEVRAGGRIIASEDSVVCSEIEIIRELTPADIFDISGGTIRLNDKRKLHSEDGPAIMHPDGTLEWWVNGKPHREDGPAIEWASGTQEWYLNGKRHREGGPAIITTTDHITYWKSLGKGYDWPYGKEEWWVNGNLHRKDGPAIIYFDGYEEFWKRGRLVDQDIGE